MRFRSANFLVIVWSLCLVASLIYAATRNNDEIPEKYRDVFEYPWSTFVKGYNEILEGEHPNYLYNSVVQIYSNEGTDSLSIPQKRMSELMPVILPKAVFEGYVNYFDILVDRSNQKNTSAFNVLEEPYCIGSNVCRFFGFTTYPGGQITSYKTNQGHFNEIRAYYEKLIDQSNIKTCEFSTDQNAQHIYRVTNIFENSIALTKGDLKLIVQINAVKAALKESKHDKETVFYVNVNGNEFISFNIGPDKRYEGSGGYLSLASNVSAFNGVIHNEYMFPILIDESYLAIWNPDGAKSGDSLLIANLRTNIVEVVGDYAWSFRKDEIFNKETNGDYEGVVDVQVDLGGNNDQLRLFPNKDYSGWIIQTGNASQLELMTYYPSKSEVVNCLRF